MNPSSSRNQLPRTLAILAVVVLLAGAGVFLFLKLRHKSAPRTSKSQHAALLETIALPAENFSISQSHVARPVSEFVNFLGVDGNSVNPTDNPNYFREILIPALKELGITRYRTVIPSQPDPATEHIENLRRLYSDANVRTILTLKLNDGKDHKLTSSPDAVKAVVNLLGASVEALEGPNEYDHEGERPDLDDFGKWTKDLYSYMQSIRTAIPNTPLLGPTFVGMNRKGGMRRTDVGDYNPQLIDYGNIHTYEYPYDTQKNKSKGRDNYERLEKHAYQRQIYRQFPPSKTYVTETGCPTIPDLGKGVTDVEQAKYLPRQLFTLFNRGYRAGCIFEMRDSGKDPKDIQKNYGILRADGSKKPSYVALKNLLDILRAKNNNDTTTRSNNLEYSITGDTKDLHQTLLQNPAGDFYLVLWRDVDSSETVSPAELTIHLKFAPKQTAMFNPLQNSAAINQQTAPGNAISVPVAYSPIVVQITP